MSIFGALVDKPIIHSIEGYSIKHARYADDTVLIVENEIYTTNAKNTIINESEKTGASLNKTKTETTIISEKITLQHTI